MAVLTAAGSPLSHLLAACVGRYGFVGKRIAALATIGSGAGGVRETPTREYPKPRLPDRVRDAIRARHGSRSTEKTYATGSSGTSSFMASGIRPRWAPPRQAHSK